MSPHSYESLEPRLPLAGDGLLVEIQAEDFARGQAGNGHQWSVVPSQAAAVGTFIGATGPSREFLQLLTLNGADSPFGSIAGPAAPFVEFDVQIEVGGVYDLRLRAAGTNSASDSLWVEMPTGALSDAQGNLAAGNALRIDTNSTGVFAQRDAGRWMLEAGLHTIRLSMRESGVAVDALQLVRPITVPANGQVEFQAESFARRQTGNGHQWAVVDNAFAGAGTFAGGTGTAGEYLRSLTVAGLDSPSGSISGPAAPFSEYDIDVLTAGQYSLRVQAAGISSASDSLWVEIIGGDLLESQGNLAVGSALRIDTNSTGVFELKNAGRWQLSAGTHTVRLAMRESGTAVDSLQLVAGDAEPPTAVIMPVSPDPRNATLDAIAIAFSEPIHGFDLADLSLDLYGDGKGSVLTKAQTLTTTDGHTWTLSGLAGITAQPGQYHLYLGAAAAGIQDLAGNLMTRNSSRFWVMDTAPPLATFGAIASPQFGPVETLGIAFSEPVAGFGLEDLWLNGQPLVGANLAGGGASWILSGLSSLTATSGEYVLTLLSGSVQDMAGNAIADDLSVAWTADIPTLTATLPPVAPNPRNASVDTLTIQFSEPVSGFDLSDLSLARNGVELLTDQSLTSADGLVWSLDVASLTDLEGNYVLKLGTELFDGLGRPLQQGASLDWTMDLTGPTAELGPVSPDPRSTAVGSLAVVFDEPVSGLTAAHLTLTVEGVPGQPIADVSTTDGVVWTIVGLDALTDGEYLLTLEPTGEIVDAAGNALSAGAQTTWRIDTVPPTGQIVAVSPNPRNTPVDSVTFQFSEPVTGFEWTDLLLDLDGDGLGNLLTAAQTLSTDDQQTWTLGNLPNPAAGRYTLSFKGTHGISDLAGNPLPLPSYKTWTVDVTPPTVDIVDVTPDPRSSWASPVSIVFSEKVMGITLNSLSLSRDGGPNLLTAAQTFGSGDQRNWYLGNLAGLTAAEGTYTLTVDPANITDLAGNPLAAGASDTWQVATYLYLSVGDLRIAFDPRYNYFPAKLERGGQPVMRYDGSTNGAVISLAGVGFVGGQHGHETLESISLFVDGAAIPVNGAGIFAGAEAVLTRTTNLGGAYRMVHTMAISPSGIDDHVSLQGLDPTKIVDRFYAFLGSRANRLTNWTAYGEDGEALASGQTGADSNVTQYMPAGTWSVAQYDPTLLDGVLTEWDVPDLGPTAFIVDRATDNKLYLDLNGLYGAADKTLEFDHRVRFVNL